MQFHSKNIHGEDSLTEKINRENKASLLGRARENNYGEDNFMHNNSVYEDKGNVKSTMLTTIQV